MKKLKADNAILHHYGEAGIRTQALFLGLF